MCVGLKNGSKVLIKRKEGPVISLVLTGIRNQKAPHTKVAGLSSQRSSGASYEVQRAHLPMLIVSFRS
jgi:hypothetical protein